MAGHIPPEFKSRMKKEGRWREFVQRRNALNLQGDLTVEQRNEQIMREFGGDPSTLPVPIHKLHERRNGVAPPLAHQKEAMKPFAPHPDCEFTAEGAKADAREIIDWIYNHMGNPAEEIIEAPSLGALVYLYKCQHVGSMQETFYNSIWPKLLPTKAQTETGDRMADDGSDVLDLIERVKSQAEGEKK
jgi:hypothetical protein